MKEKKKPNTTAQEKVQEVVDTFVSAHSLRTDPQGSYTGTARPDEMTGKPEHPVQDADDL